MVLRLGASLAVIPVHSNVIQPPKTTEGISPISLAANPDSKAQISFDDPIKILLTDDTLPRISSGVKSCIIVDLMSTLMASKAPDKANSINDNQKDVDKANPIIESPKRATKANSIFPELTMGACRVTISAVNTAPIDGEALKIPNPSGPT